MIDLSIIIVSWNIRDQLKNCLQSIHAFTKDLNIEIFVVDNNSSDGTCRMVFEKFPIVKLVGNKANVGFAKANNQAMYLCTGRYVLLLNPDTVIYQKSFANMIKFMDSHPNAAACTCKILDNKKNIFCFRTKELTLKDELFRDTLFGWLFSSCRKQLEKMDYNRTQKVNRIPGTCMMVRREVVEKVGMLDERYFLYVEDDDWCRRINQIGEIYYVANAAIEHLQGKSSEQVREKAWRVGTNSRFLFYEKYYGNFPTFLLRIALLSSAAISFVKWKGIYIFSKENKEIYKKLAFYRTSMEACLGLGKKVV